MTPRERKTGGAIKKRHVLGVGWTRYEANPDLETGRKIWLVKEKDNRGYQMPLPLKLQLWDKKARLVLEEV